MPKSAKQDARVIASSEDTARALDLRREGRTHREIAAELGRSLGWVHGAIKAYIEDHPLPHAEAYRAEVLERQAGIIATHWPTRADPECAKIIQAADKIIMAVTGAEAPRRTELTGINGGPIATRDVTLMTDEQLQRIALGLPLGPPSESGAGDPEAPPTED